MTTHTITVLTEVEVDVDLSRFDKQALLSELRDRNDLEVSRRLATIEAKHALELDDLDRSKDDYFHIPPLNSDEKHPLHGIYYALKFGKKEHAIDLMRDYLSDQFGVVL